MEHIEQLKYRRNLLKGRTDKENGNIIKKIDRKIRKIEGK